eukprot:c28350_g2_i1 orf=854-3484(+)
MASPAAVNLAVHPDVNKSDHAGSNGAPKQSLKFVLLHGTLEVWIQKAECLPNMDIFSERMRQCFVAFGPFRKLFSKTEDHVEHHTEKKITSDPYVSVVLRGATVARTRVIKNEQNPEWNEHFSIPVAHDVAEVEFVVKDNDVLGAQFIGETKISAEYLLTQEVADRWFDLLGKDGKPCKPGARLKVSLSFRLAATDPLYKDGVGAGPNYSGVPYTYFPLHKGGRITLYQDADILDNSLPQIKLDGGLIFEHRRSWEEICLAILEAHHLVYIAGWSIYCETKLVRRTDKHLPEPAFYTLGELLKFKSRELVRVLLLVWDDKTSHRIIKNEGVMGTHDEETKRFFKHSSVQCVLAPRYADSKLSWVKQKVVGTLYTHHQKLVIVDTQGPGNFRKLTAFIGGLDLCDGRYDTPEHCLFRTLNTVHKDDYHNPTFPSNADSGGPRQPWHDLHCKIEGPAVYDVLTNFEQRWRRATRWHELGKNCRRVTRWHDDALADLDNISWILSPNKRIPYESPHTHDGLIVLDEDDPETWHVQVFRSIDSGSVKGFPKIDVVEAEKQNLVCGKNIAIDMSIHTAYIKAIRSAQHYIYIENQYFIGSSYAWPKYKNAGAHHLIPIELALKIASKIKAKERFAVYIVIPMWPEGVPDSSSVQEILYFQGQTLEMMYTIVAQALEEENMLGEFHPTDYLNFFCLGNREVKGEDECSPMNPPPENSSQMQAQKNRRFMIYVHSKGLIVDDEYIIIGSANINQRSMDGSRDTEIAMGAYQPHHTWAHKHDQPFGQIYGFRMSLWAEHMGGIEDCFLKPWSLECVRRVNSIAKGYWKQYTAEEVTEMKGHLLAYPIKVEDNGKVVALPGWEQFPDVGGRVLGSSSTLPDNLTT